MRGDLHALLNSTAFRFPIVVLSDCLWSLSWDKSKTITGLSRKLLVVAHG